MKKRYTSEFKDQAIGLVKLGKPVAEVCRGAFKAGQIVGEQSRTV
jgi:hypothetical protein